MEPRNASPNSNTNRDGTRGQFRQTDPGSRDPIVADDVVAVGHDDARGRIDYPVYHVDERRLTGAIWSQQGEYHSGADLQVDFLKGLEARGVGLGEIRYGNNRPHGTP